MEFIFPATPIPSSLPPKKTKHISSQREQKVKVFQEKKMLEKYNKEKTLKVSSCVVPQALDPDDCFLTHEAAVSVSELAMN